MSKYFFLPGLALIFALPAAAAPSDNGQALYDQHCVSCHGPEIYTRDDRKVTSLQGLERQVQRCELALGLKWFDEEISDVTKLLNERFYRFEP
jgi:hypothetical protein